MNKGLQRVLLTLAGQPPTSYWAKAEQPLKLERSRIEGHLDAGRLGEVYGFTTLLGHLDDRPLGDQQAALFHAHLVGPTTHIPWRLAQVLLACKIEQLAQGGSGVRPELFRELVAATARTRGPCEGNWRYSYGSGDVVQGAWLVHAVADNLIHEPGDLIALINGTHVSTGMAAMTVVAAAGELAEFVEVYQSVSRSNDSRSQQRPVSLRDAKPVLRQVHAALKGAGVQLEKRLAHPSGNPLFTEVRGKVYANSQSSFLGFELTTSLTQLIQTVSLALGVWQRVIEHTCADLSTHCPTGLLQPPKIAQAILESHLLSTGLPARFSGQDSHGVEDLRDLSLITTWELAGLLRGMQAMRSVWAGLPRENAHLATCIAATRQKMLNGILDSPAIEGLEGTAIALEASRLVCAWRGDPPSGASSS